MKLFKRGSYTMFSESLGPDRGTKLRKNGQNPLRIMIEPKQLNSIFIINGKSFITNNVSESDLNIAPNACYLIINKRNKPINIKYSEDVSHHEVIYDPYKYEKSNKENLNPKDIIEKFDVPDGYIDVLAKWYSIKFTYPDHNLIFIKPEMGISIQIHHHRSEIWKILGGFPIIINGNKVFYFAKKNSVFKTPILTYHSVINPNKEPDNFVIIEERWEGKFDEKDIVRVFNPNHYY
ncbi:MAG: hypothetical protein ACTSRH_05950 [Promethearchaeota archaeon]